MKTKLIVAALALAMMMTSGVAMATYAADQDTTPVTQCENLPPSVSIAVVGLSETANVCSEMSRVLEGIRRKDITHFEKAVAILRFSRPSYGTDNAQILKELIEIIRLRGLYARPDRWYDTNDLIVRAWSAFHGAVGPRQIIASLQKAGPEAAKAVSDDGLLAAIILMKNQYQSGTE